MKKVVAQPDKWLKNVVKYKRNKGEEYLTTSGVLRPAKKVQPSCTGCIYKCPTKISDKRRQEIFNFYWGLGDLTLQRAFILNLLKIVKTKYRRLKKNATRNRSLNYAYHFTASFHSDQIRVCKTFFLNTLNISYVTVDTALKKFNTSNGILQGEIRGKHPRYKNDSEKKNDSAGGEVMYAKYAFPENENVNKDESKQQASGSNVQIQNVQYFPTF